MVKKSIIAILLFCIAVFISSTAFASNLVNATGNTLNGIRDGVQNMASDAGNSMERAKDGIGGAMENAGDGLENMAHNAGSAMENAKDGISNMLHDGEDGVRRAEDDMENTAGTVGRDMDSDMDGYTATRTSATDALGTTRTNNTVAIWTVLALAGAIIIALIWYYATQTNNTDRY